MSLSERDFKLLVRDVLLKLDKSTRIKDEAGDHSREYQAAELEYLTARKSLDAEVDHFTKQEIESLPFGFN